jgi:hypothetical protein
MPGHVISSISPGFPELSQSQGQVAHVLLTRSPLIHPRRGITVRLACVKHAASVRPEPGSNSPLTLTKPPPPQKTRTAEETKQRRTKNPRQINATTRPKPSRHTHLTKGTNQHEPDQEQPQPQPMPEASNNWHRHKKHTVEFSRNGRSPQAAPESWFCRGNPSMLHLAGLVSRLCRVRPLPVGHPQHLSHSPDTVGMMLIVWNPVRGPATKIISPYRSEITADVSVC